MTNKVKDSLKTLPVIVSMFQVNTAYSQDWRADAEISGGEGGLTFIIILGLIAVYLEFKKGSKQGFLALAYVAGVSVLSIIFPMFGGIVIGLLLIAVIYVVVKDYWR